MALSADRNTPIRDGHIVVHPVAASQKIYAGALVALDANGYAVPGSAAATLTAAGRAEEQVDNTAGTDGAKTVNVRRGVFRYLNSGGGDAITRAEIGDLCYIADDQTVAKTDATGTRSAAGKVIDIDNVGVWVEIG